MTPVETQNKTNELVPYIFFYGRCEEALTFYKTVFNGTYELQRNADSPMSDQVPADRGQKVMHARFTAPGVVFMASDGQHDKTIDPDAGNVSLALTAVDRAEGERIFKALAQGGNVSMPFSDAPWGGQFGALSDRFGTEWLIAAS